MIPKEAIPFKRPSFVGVVQMGLPEMGNIVAVRTYHDGGVEVLGRRGPLVGNVSLFRVPDDNVAVMLQGGGASPER